MTVTCEDPVLEASRLADVCGQVDLPFWVLGGVAVRMLCPSALQPPLLRPIGDLDFVTDEGMETRLTETLEGNGYAPHREVNMLQGHRRLVYFDRDSGRKVDVFVGKFEMCHEVPLERSGRTIHPSCLLVTKLQIVQLNEKDVKDILALFQDLDLESEEDLHAAWIADLTSTNWGLWTTLMDSLDEVAELSSRYVSAGPAMARISGLQEILASSKKSRGWKLRARVGRRKRWYQVPEELEAGGISR